MRLNNSKSLYLLGLLTILLLVYWRWFFDFSVLTSGDWGFLHPETAKEYFQLPFAWSANSFGEVGLTISQYPYRFILGLLSNFADFFLTERILFLWPCVLLSLFGSFSLIKKITKSEIAAMVGTLVYLYNTYFILGRNGSLTLQVAFALSPFVLFFFMKTLEEKNIKQALTTGMLLFAVSFYEFRAFYIVAFVLFFYFLYYSFFIDRVSIKNLSTNSRFALLPIIFVFLTNFYWILGLSRVGAITSNDIFSRELFGNSFMDILRSITLFHPFWTGVKMEPFVVQLIPLYFFLIPFFAFLGMILKRDDKNILFFGYISLLGVFLAKQIGEPFAGVYQWLYDNFPGFNAFREASKFYFLTALGYSVLIGAFISWLCENLTKSGVQVYVKYFLTIMIAILFLWNTKPIITGQIGGLSISKNIPSDYVILKNFISNQSESFRTFWVPRDSRWGIFVNKNSKISNVSMVENQWKDLLGTYNKNDKLIQNRIINAFKQSFSDNLFDTSSIKYVIVPSLDGENDDNFFIFYGGRENADIRNWYISELDKIKWLKKINIGTKEVVVYENLGYKQSIFALSRLYALDSVNGLDKKNDFINMELHGEFQFVISEKNINKKPLLIVSDPFETSGSKNIDSSLHKLMTASNFDYPENNNSIYINKNNSDVYVKHDQGSIVVFLDRNGDLKLNNNSIDNSMAEFLATTTLESGGKKYYASLGDKLKPLVVGGVADMGGYYADDGVNVFTTSDNVITNPSFENGSWREKVGDCHEYDNNGLIDMRLNDEEKTDGGKSLQLEATRHIACTSQRIRVQAEADYVFSFDYQSPNSKQAGFYLQFNDENKSIVKGGLPIDDVVWQRYFKKITIPTGANSASLFVYAYSSDQKTSNIVRYDNFNFSKLQHKKEIKINNQNIGFKKGDVGIIKGKNVFDYDNKKYDYQNIFNNGSFENKLWTEKVVDCNNYDKNGDISMRLNDEKKTDGGYSLELGAVKHTACTGVSVGVKGGSTYLLSFDYQGNNSEAAGYHIGFNSGNEVGINEKLEIKNTGWNYFERKIKIPESADNLNLSVYAYESDGRKNNIVRYDNFKLINIPNLEDKYYLTSEPIEKNVEPGAIIFDLVNPTKKILHIRGATTPFFLAMSESYHEQWQVQMNNQKIQGIFNKWWPFAKPDRVVDEYHYKLNNFLNGWYIDVPNLCSDNSACSQNDDGSYDMEMVIEFWPQRWFYFGLIISGLTLFSSLGYLIYNFLKTKWQKN